MVSISERSIVAGQLPSNIQSPTFFVYIGYFTYLNMDTSLARCAFLHILRDLFFDVYK